MSHYYSLLEKINKYGELIGPRGLQTKELLGVNLLVNDYNFFATPIIRPYEEVYKYLYAELCWYLSGERDITKILPYSRFWASIRNKDNTANSNYGDLVFYRKNSHGVTSFDWARQALINDKMTRKALVLYNDRDLFYPENNDLICNQYQHFLIRNDELICFVGLRSSDAIYGLTFNIPWWSFVHQQMFLKMKMLYPKITLGRIEAFISSSHIYENKFDLVDKILEAEQQKFFIRWNSVVPLGAKFEWYQEKLKNYFSVEKVS